ncbi:MAG: histidine phosphatase family protein [Anaerolineales bacterium]
MHLYLIRHGQSVENTMAWDGRNDNSALTETGQAQAQALAEWLASRVQFDRFYVSTMQRTRQTAAPLVPHLTCTPIYSDELREVGNAYPDGRPFPDDALPMYYQDVWGSTHPYDPVTENGENWMQFRARVGAFLQKLINERPNNQVGYTVGVVCHGGVIEGFFEHIFQKGPISPLVIHTNNTGITLLEYSPTPRKMPDWWLRYHNNTRHLSEDLIT